MIDVFSGHDGDRRFGVVGTSGNVCALRTQATNVLLATYCDPQEGALHISVPIPTWPSAACNDAQGVPNVPTSRGYFDRTTGRYEWLWTYGGPR